MILTVIFGLVLKLVSFKVKMSICVFKAASFANLDGLLDSQNE